MPPVVSFPSATLPSQLTEFVGRGQELEMVVRLVRDSRLVTLTGAGGSGKTRLAHAVASFIAEREPASDVAWIELAPVQDSASVLPTVASALGAPTDASTQPLASLVAMLRDRDMLLVLDNCEHQLEASATLVDALLRGCPRLRILATSREALGVAGERSWLVPPLAVPDGNIGSVADALDAGAVLLFVARASDASPSFSLSAQNVGDVVEVCRRLDGLPLALELAAARIAVLTPRQLAERLGDRFSLLTTGARPASPRQRTLRGTVDWSYDLLTSEERLLLERLGAFQGGFTLDAAEAVCGAGSLPPGRVLETLVSLATKSLVAMQESEGGVRYRLLETVREYALERYAQRRDDADIGERHATYYRDLTAELYEPIILARPDALHLVDVEHGNLSAALAWSVAAGRGTDVGLPLVRRLTWYWYHRQLWAEGFEAAEQALASAHAASAGLRGTALHALGVFGLHRGSPKARDHIAEARRCWEEAGDERWMGFTLIVSAVTEAIIGNWEASRAFAEQAIAVTSRQPSPWDRALANAHCYAAVLSAAGDWQAATALLEESIATYREVGYPVGIAYALDALAFTRFQLGEHDRAAALAAQAIREEPSGQNRWLVARSLRLLANVVEESGDLAGAVQLFAAGEAALDSISAALLTAERPHLNSLPERLRARMQPEAFEAAWSAGYTMRYDDSVTLGLASAERVAPGVEGTHGTAVAVPKTVPDAASNAAAHDAAAGDDAVALDVRALGSLEIRRDGVLLPDSAWPYAKPRELLLYLLSHPDGRTREQIGLDFWPDASAAQVKNNFHVTLHHLRKALGGAAWVRYERGRYRIAGEAGLRYDAADLERKLDQALRRWAAKPGTAAAVTALSDALKGCTGRFLEDVEAGDWHLEVRDRLARLQEEALLELGQHWSVEGRHAEAVERFRALLAIDPLHEEGTRLLMLSLARSGKRAEALRAYERLQAEMRAALEADPSPRIRAVAEAIRGGEAV